MAGPQTRRMHDVDLVASTADERGNRNSTGARLWGLSCLALTFGVMLSLGPVLTALTAVAVMIWLALPGVLLLRERDDDVHGIVAAVLTGIAVSVTTIAVVGSLLDQFSAVLVIATPGA